MEFLTTLVNGLSLGGIYAMIALGYTMVYGIAKMLNFAHGDIIMIGGYTVSESLVEAELSSLYGGNFAVNFRASVVQSIGFDSVEAAWNSVKAH